MNFEVLTSCNKINVASRRVVCRIGCILQDFIRGSLQPVIHFLMVATLAVTSACASSAHAAEKGKPLPELKAFALEGEVPATRGKVLLLDFWASWCGPCKKSFPAIEELHRAYKGRGLTVLAVSVDEDEAAMKSFLKQHAVTFAVARDAKHKLVETVKVSTMPTSLLVDRRGVIRFVNSGFNGVQTEKLLRQQIEQLLGEGK